MEKILQVKNLKVEFKFAKGKKLNAVNNLDLDIKKGEVVGLVGESGSGKSMTALSIMRLVPYPGKIKNGEIYINKINKNLLQISEKKMVDIRGKLVSMIFQDPLSSLNPCFRIGWHLKEVVRSNDNKLNKKERKDIIIDTLKKVRFNNVDQLLEKYPHELSGGMRQRVTIAMAIIMNRGLVLADEPTTALDVTTQDEIFNLIEEIREKYGISFLIISHNLYLVGERCDRMYVIYAGQIVEEGEPIDIFENPLHPYTKCLIKSIPKLEVYNQDLYTIRGELIDLMNLPEKGCFFRDRCDYSEEICSEIIPDIKKISEKRFVRCHMYFNYE